MECALLVGIVLLDVHPGNICTPGFGVDMSLQNIIHYPSTLHHGLGVIAFADSHARWLYTGITRAAKRLSVVV